MGERPRVLLVLVVGVVLGDVGCAVADEGAGIQPVVRPYGHRHQAEGGERPHGGEEDLDPLLTHHAFSGEVVEGLKETSGHEGPFHRVSGEQARKTKGGFLLRLQFGGRGLKKVSSW